MLNAMVVAEAEAIELFAYLISSARTQLDEPCRYASMRLLTAAEILRDIMMTRVSPDTLALLEETVKTTNHANINMNDAEIYAATLDKLCRQVAKFTVSQSESSKGKS